MEEILIGDKKYVSSKQAAKATGYAKDYIGQLCREGRVPARLVGRSWYVLESAIHDHRFGEQKAMESPKKNLETTWESPRYEASEKEEFPSIEHLVEEERTSSAGDQEDTLLVGETEEVAAVGTEQLQDAWKAWFDKVVTTPHVVETDPDQVQIAHQEIEEPEKPEIEVAQEQEVVVPMKRTVYVEPPKELLPRRIEQVSAIYEDKTVLSSSSPAKQRTRSRVIVMHTAGYVLAVIIVGLAAMSTGIFDKYIASYTQASQFSGVIMYNK